MESTSHHSKHFATFGVTAAAIVFFWIALATYVVDAAMPSNPVELPGQAALQTRVWALEQWNFFTKDPHYERLGAFVMAHDGKWRAVPRRPRSHWRNAFGLDRASEAFERELNLLADHVRLPQLATCKGDPVACLSKAPEVGRVRNNVENPSLCGKVGLVLRRPTPWAWRQDGVVMSARIVRLEVQC